MCDERMHAYGVQVLEGKASMSQLAKNWALSYAGNFVGSLLMVYLVVATGLLATAPAPLNIAVAKTSLSFSQAWPKRTSPGLPITHVLVHVFRPRAARCVWNTAPAYPAWQCLP